MQHVGYVLKVFPRLSQTFVVNELRAHERAGCAITIFSLKRPRPEDADLVQPPPKFPVVYLDSPPEQWPEKLATLARTHRITHLHAHFGNIATQVARSTSQLVDIPYTFTAHALDIFDRKVDQEELGTKIRDAAAVVTVSDFNVRHFRDHFSRRAVLIYNGMPLDSMSCNIGPRPNRTILAVGRLIEKKGFTHLIEACGELGLRKVQFRCEIIGSGPLENALRSQIAKLGLENCVELPGSLPPGEVRERMRNATMLAAPCVIATSGDRDGLPTVLLEAMAIGTPVVSTDVTGIPEVVIDQATGLLTPPKNVKRLADACQILLEDPELAERLARNARRLVEERFDSNRTSSQLRQLWARPQRRIVFRILNRRGMGHWMRGQNVARAMLAQESWTDILFYTRSKPPFAIENDPIRYSVAVDPQKMDLSAPAISGFTPHLVVDDTILKDYPAATSAKRVLIMRRLTAEKQQELFAAAALKTVDLVIVPHTRQEFGHELPSWMEDRTQFVGPVVRQPDESRINALREKYSLKPGDFLLVSTPGGGGFDEDTERFFETATRVHRQLQLPGLRHLLIRGPNANVSAEPTDERMTIVDAEPELVSLFTLADAVISAGGYNTVNELRLTKRPAFFLPGRRKYDDQVARVEELARRGLAWVMDNRNPRVMASAIADTLTDPRALEQVRARYAEDRFIPGNQLAAETILSCAHE